MGKKSKKKVLTFEEFASRVMRLVKHLKLVIDELERQRQRITKLEKTIESLRMEIDTLKAKISGRPIEKKPSKIPTPPEPLIEAPQATPESKPEEPSIDELLPEFPEIPSPDEVSAPPIEEVLPEVPTTPEHAPAPKEKPKTIPDIPELPEIPSPTPTKAPKTPPAAPAPAAPEPSIEDYSDLDKYLDKLDQIVEQIGVPEISEETPTKEEVVPEISPEAGEAGTTVSSDELKKKKKDILKALTELESA